MDIEFAFDPVVRALLLALAAMAVDWLVGDPPWLWRRIHHPVVLLGGLTALLEHRLNHFDQPDADIASPTFGSVINPVSSPTSIFGFAATDSVAREHHVLAE